MPLRDGEQGVEDVADGRAAAAGFEDLGPGHRPRERVSAPGAELDAADDVVQAGDRAPDALVVDQDGRSLRLHEAFRGPHFTLVAVGGPAVEALKSVRWPDEGAELKTVAVPEPGEGLKRAYGISGPVQVLVRPDGYVVHVAHDDFAATLVTRAGMMLPARV